METANAIPWMGRKSTRRRHGSTLLCGIETRFFIDWSLVLANVEFLPRHSGVNLCQPTEHYESCPYNQPGAS